MIGAPRLVRSGFTLLETLLAMTVVASMTVLIAQAYSIAHQAADGGAHLERAVKVQRVVRLIGDQWGDRRSLMLDGAETKEASSDQVGPAFLPDRVRFVTATPALAMQWPLVEASYIIEQAEAEAGAAPMWNLVYEERPITSFRTDRTVHESKSAQLDLLAGCTGLRMEQFIEDEDQSVSSTSDAPSRKQWIWMPFELRDVDESQEQVMPMAVRIVGEYQGEAVTCVFVAKALR